MRSSSPPLSCRVTGDAGRQFIFDVLLGSDVTPEHARRIADAMIEADLTGADAHGIFRLPQYIRAVQAGTIDPRAAPELLQTGPSTALLDGRNSFGHLAMSIAADAAIGMAGRHGIGWVGVHRSNHAGAGAVYTSQVALSGLIGVYGAVSGINHMAPSGASIPLLGTNPLSIAVPYSETEPLVMDMAMSVASAGKIMRHATQGLALPDGWVVRRQDGQALNDASQLNDGMLSPMGDHKGIALSFFIGILAGVLNGAAFGRDIPDFAAGKDAGGRTGQFIVALDVSRFISLDTFQNELKRHIADMEGSPRIDGNEAIRLPGRQRQERRRQRQRNGFLLPMPLVEELDALAAALKVPALLRAAPPAASAP